MLFKVDSSETAPEMSNERSLDAVDEFIQIGDYLPFQPFDDINWETVPTSLDQTAPDSLGTITGNIPSRDDFPGRYNFDFSLDQSASGQQWVYSQPLKQVFIIMNKLLVMQFRMNPDLYRYAEYNTPSTMYIRALPVYSTDDYVNIPVNRCTIHSVEDDPHGKAHQIPGICLCHENNLVGHVVRAGCDAEYLYDPRSERHSVRVAVKAPQPGSDHILIPYSFACKTSCPKGMQRRPIHVIFTLEDQDANVYGRQKLGVKICSCPKRDKKRQEEDYCAEKFEEKGKKKRPITTEDLANALNCVKKVKVEEEEEEEVVEEEKEDDPPFPFQKEEIVEQIYNDLNEAKHHYFKVGYFLKRIEKKMEFLKK